MKFINTYASLPEKFSVRLAPEQAPSPQLLAWNKPLAEQLGIDPGLDPAQLTRWFSGQESIPGSEPMALAYAGHQFGNFVPQLGDGRANLLGEVLSPFDGKGYDIQLKGSGQTPFSRRGDGKSSLGPVIREYLLSEAMHRLGVPTTRALAAVSTGETVFRESMEPGGVLTRVASSHIRVGTFQYFAAREDKEALQLLTDYAIERHYPQVKDSDTAIADFFVEVTKAQARLVAHWMSVGFIHGVMNTDNMAISGETLDFGPCAFLDEFHIDKVFSSIDRQSRYAYSNQANMAKWNLARLAECLLILDERTEVYQELLGQFDPAFERHYFKLMREKLGLTEALPEDPKLITAWLQHLQNGSLDFSLSFIDLAEQVTRDSVTEIEGFSAEWLRRLDRQPGGRAAALEKMSASNPRFIPRNHQVERAIRAAFQGDFQVFHELQQVLAEPYTDHPGLEAYAVPPAVEERVEMTFCGT